MPEYYEDFAVAFIRGSEAGVPSLDPDELIEWARARNIELARYKRKTVLPRVVKVIGMLRGLWPESLLDIGSGRGTALWPLMAALPTLPVKCVEKDPLRLSQLDAVSSGGIDRLQVIAADAAALPLDDRCVDLVTALEVVEHTGEPRAVISELLRVAVRGVIVSVPSKPDDNPEHHHFFEAAELQQLILSAGAKKVTVEHVLNHRIAFAVPQ